MKGSHSDRSEQESGIRNRESAGIGTQESVAAGSSVAVGSADDRFPVRRSRFGVPRPIAVIVVAYAAAHLVWLAPSLEDIDSINFALGLRHFDVANHQPHPPGYPVYIALGRVSLAAIRTLAPSVDAVRAEAMALAIWSALGGAVALLAAWSIYAHIGRYRSTPSTFFSMGDTSFWATALLAATPLFWISGQRPLSDMPGLALAMTAQALALGGLTERKRLVVAALLAGLAAGVRGQTACLTVPLLVFAMWSQRAAGLWWLLTRPLAALLLGALSWAIPLIALSGGFEGYLKAVASQAGEDFAWTGMLWTNPTPRRLAFALWETFALPWEAMTLTVVAGMAALAGAIVLVLNERRALVVMGLAFAPYLAFHLLFQETVFVRYALPTLPIVVWMMSRGVMIAGRAAPYVGVPLVAAALGAGVPAGLVYSSEAHPAFRAIAAMKTAAATSSPGAIYSHFSLRRMLQAAAPDRVAIVEPRRSYEWLGLVDYWRRGGDAPVWFLADARRTDLALIDPQSRTRVTPFRWAAADRWTMSGARPTNVDWYVLHRPGWFAGEGWALTPEVGGLSQAAGTGVDRRPIEAYVRRRSGPMRVMVGGRHFSAAGDPAAAFSLAIDGTIVETWTVDPAPGGVSFLRFIDLPSGLPSSGDQYARVTIAARAEPASGPTPQVAIRQFDIQSIDTLMYGFGDGWHEEEYETATGLRWRWTSGRSVIRIAPPQAVELVVRGDSPLKYLDAAPTVRVTAADRVVAELRPEREFTWRVIVPADVAKHAAGSIAVETDRIYLPGQAERTDDPRRLGLRLFETTVAPIKDTGRP